MSVKVSRETKLIYNIYIYIYMYIFKQIVVNIIKYTSFYNLNIN